MFNGEAKRLRSVFLVGFILTIAISLTGYLDSSFLSKYVRIEKVGLLFSVGSLASIFLLSRLPKLISKIGTPGVFYLNSLAYLTSILGMLNTGNSKIFELLFVTYLASGISIYFIIDILIEHFSKNGSTGNTRGFYLAIYNLAYLIGPLLAGILLKNNSYELVYLLAGVFIIIMTLVYIRDLEKVETQIEIKKTSFWKNLVKLSKNKDIFYTYMASFMLNFFFSWMSIFMPIYLNKFIGFGWDKIGAIFAIMHIPYITLEIPIGKIADKLKCEKQIISIGLVIIGISTALISKISGPNFILWMIGLMATRTGASFVQVGTESYFFKKVTEKDSGLIAVFRNASPVAYIIGPAIATILLSVVSYGDLFIILGAIMIFGVIPSMKIKNIK